MQTALLSAGIAVILALLTALVGPLFVDWDSYRTVLETRVANLTGLEVRVTGPIDVRILPTPTLTLSQIELGRKGDQAKTRAKALRIEFALGDLLRGEWRAPELKLQGPELMLGLDPNGRLDWSAPTIGLDPDAVSIDHIEIADGRVVFSDATSGGQLVLENVEFTGQVRSLLGPAKGEGSFVVAGQRYPFRLSVARPADDGSVKVRLNLDQGDLPRTADVDGLITIEQGIPHFEGTMQVAHPINRTADATGEPWRVSSHVEGSSTAMVLQQLEFQYGSEEQAIRLKGDARVTFGSAPEFDAALSAPQLDLDRILALPEADGRRPLIAIRGLVETILGAPHLPVPVKLAVSVDTVTLAGAMLQRVGGDLKSISDGWDIEKVSFRAPGLSQMAFSGRLDATPAGAVFKGATRIDSADPRALAGWLANRSSGPPVAGGALHATSDIALGGGKIVLDRLQADLDRTKIDGHVDYAWPNGDQPAKLNATLHAGELDLDRLQSLMLASLGDFEWPREGALALDIGRATSGGVEATNIVVKMRRDAGVLDIERLAVDDLGGARFAIGGRVETHDSARGALTLDLDARRLDGLAALAEKLSPAAADRIRRIASGAVPVKLHTSLSFDRGAGANTTAKLGVQGTAGSFRVDLHGDADGATVASIDPARLGATKVHLAGLIDAGDGGALVGLLGLDRLVAVSQRWGRLTLDLNGPFDGDMAVKGALVAGGLDVSGSGTWHPLGGNGPGGNGRGGNGPSAQIALRASAADVVPLRPALARRDAQAPWTTLTTRLTVAGDTLKLADLDGTLAGVGGIKGNLGIVLAAPTRVDGNLSVNSLDLPAVIGAAVGFPRANPSGDGLWSTDPFEPGVLGSVSGQIAIRAGQVALTSKLGARDVAAVVELSPTELTVTDIKGALAGGSVAGELGFARGDDGVAAHGRISLADVDAAGLLGGGARPPVAGKLTADLALEGAGRSPIALVGSLKGGGKLTLRDGSVARFDPGAFDAVTHAVDQGLPIDTTRISDRVEAALAVGGLPVSLVEGSISASLGQLRLGDLTVRATGAELAPTGDIDLTQGAIDARLVLSGPKSADTGEAHPDVAVTLKGPLDAPKRSLEIAALTNWLARRAADQKAKKVDALEHAAREHPLDGGDGPPEPAEHEPIATVPTTPASPSSLPRLVRPATPLTSSVAPPARQHSTQDAPTAPADGAKTSDEPRSRRSSTAEQVPPPPIDIRPTAPRPRTETRPDNSPKTDQRPFQPLRSLFPGLFGQ